MRLKDKVALITGAAGGVGSAAAAAADDDGVIGRLGLGAAPCLGPILMIFARITRQAKYRIALIIFHRLAMATVRARQNFPSATIITKSPPAPSPTA